MKNSLKLGFTKTGVAVVALAAFVLPNITLADTLYRQLQLGMSGSDVSSLQTFLAQDNTIYPQGLVTGYFGGLTKSAVSNFQARNGIATVGRVGPQTLSVINAQMNGGGTMGVNQVAPSIYQVAVSTSASSVNISWNTDELSAGIVYYSQYPMQVTEASAGMSVNITGATAVANLDARTSHSATVSGLSPNTNYYYVVYAKDTTGNESVTVQNSFRTNN
jgi:peptidoglycan hydrolase-like protein with peptidoglycan-binding domain